MIKTVLFFAREYQSVLFPRLCSEKFKSVYVVLNKREKQNVLDNGGIDVICLEDQFDSLELVGELGAYLKYSFGCDRNYVGLNLSEREIVLKKSIAFWRNILEKYKPDLVVNETVAIQISEVLAIEAKSKGIKYLSWMSFPKKNTFYWQASPYHNSLKKTSFNEIVPTDSNIQEARSFIRGVQEGSERPFYVKNNTNRHSFLKFAKIIWSVLLEVPLIVKLPKLKRRMSYGTTLGKNFWNMKLFIISLFTFSNKYDDIKDYSDKELIFYPLHYEPEAVLFYMAYFFDNQASVVENTLKCINQNQILVVKEHPQLPGVLLEKRFRKIRKRYPNLIFISGESSTIETLSKCTTVVTLGSTAGFEALALGKRVINLGRVFYDSFEGVNNCKSFVEVYRLMRGIVPFNVVDNFDVFVAKMLTYVKPGNPFLHDDVYSPQNIGSIKKAIEDELGG